MFRSIKVAFYLAYKSVTRGNYYVLLMNIGVIIIVFLNLSFLPSLTDGVVKNLNNKLIDNFSSNIVISPPSNESDIENANAVVDNISAIEGVKSVSHRYKLPAQISFEGEKTAAEIFGIDVNKDRKVFTTPKFMIEGSFLEPDDQGKIVLGVQLAGSDQKNLELYSTSLKSVHAGDKVKVNYSNGLEKEYTVKGIFKSEMILADKQGYITEKELAEISSSLGDKATNLYVKTEKTGDEDRIINDIMQKYPKLKYQTWKEIAGLIKNTTDSLEIINNTFKVISLLIAGLTIFIVTYIDLVNKRRQIGVERAIGIKGSSIVGSYVIHAVFYALVGVYLAYLIFIYIGIPLESRYPFQFPNGPVVLSLNQPYLTGNAIILIIVAIISALLPSWRAIKIKILDAIWGV